jgi:uncharacterized membrane protein
MTPPTGTSDCDQTPSRTLHLMYEAILVVHIVSGFAWVGGGLSAMVAAGIIKRNEGQATAESTIRLLDKATWPIGFAPPIVLLTGIAQVVMNDSWDFSQLWIILAIVLVVAAFSVGAGFLDPWQKQMEEARQEGRSLPGLFNRFLRLGWLEMAVMIAIVALMVYKPG